MTCNRSRIQRQATGERKLHARRKVHSSRNDYMGRIAMLGWLINMCCCREMCTAAWQRGQSVGDTCNNGNFGCIMVDTEVACG